MAFRSKPLRSRLFSATTMSMNGWMDDLLCLLCFCFLYGRLFVLSVEFHSIIHGVLSHTNMHTDTTHTMYCAVYWPLYYGLDQSYVTKLAAVFGHGLSV